MYLLSDISLDPILLNIIQEKQVLLNGISVTEFYDILNGILLNSMLLNRVSLNSMILKEFQQMICYVEWNSLNLYVILNGIPLNPMLYSMECNSIQ